MKKMLAMLSLVFLASCNNGPEELKHTRDDQKFSVELVIVPDNQITDTCSKLGVQYEANGCNAFYPNEKKCVIYVMKQRFMYDEERLKIIGHELWHCRYGQWHD